MILTNDFRCKISEIEILTLSNPIFSKDGVVFSIFLNFYPDGVGGGASGVGWYIKYYTNYGKYENTVSGIVVASVFILLLNFILKKVRKRVIIWQP